MDSILISIKKMLGVEADDTAFDTDIIIHINSAFMVLFQLGLSESAFKIQGRTDVWSDFLLENTDLESVKSYIYLKVRLIFDPPSSSFVLESMKNLVAEFEWRLNVQAEPPST